MFWFGKSQTPETDKYAAEMQTWKARAELASAQLDTAQSLMRVALAENARLSKINVGIEKKANEVKVSAAKSQRALDRIRDSIKTAGVDTTGTLWQQAEGYRKVSLDRLIVIEQKEAVIANQVMQISGLETSLKTISDRADSLQKKIETVPPTPKPKRLLGLFPQPSRVTSFISGAIVGTVGVIALIAR